jgi:hypothetical protein
MVDIARVVPIAIHPDRENSLALCYNSTVLLIAGGSFGNSDGSLKMPLLN